MYSRIILKRKEKIGLVIMGTKISKILFVLIVSISISCSSISCLSMEKTKVKVVAWLGNEVIELPLFKKTMDIQSFQVAIYFNDKYGVKLDNKPESWKKEYKEGSPLKMLKELALDEAKRIKTTLMIAKNRGLIKTVNYDDIQKYDNESLKNAFKVRINESEIAALPVYDRDVFLRFLEIVESVLKKNIRDGINRHDIEDYVKKHDVEYLRRYIRIRPEDERDRNQLVRDIVSDKQKFSVMKDLVQEDKYRKVFDEQMKSVVMKVNNEVYEKISFD